tara:strand:- start:315 stop:419 length:105 start_codon:yes stop_codon:yes gene_type:complete
MLHLLMFSNALDEDIDAKIIFYARINLVMEHKND